MRFSCRYALRRRRATPPVSLALLRYAEAARRHCLHYATLRLESRERLAITLS